MRRAIRKHMGDFAAIMALVAIAFGVSAYVLFHQLTRPYFPVIEASPYELKAEFTTAQAVTPGQGQSVRVAGVQVGKITGVDLDQGRAVVTMQLDHKYNNLVHQGASALLRPKTGLNDMFIELNPGPKSAPKMKEDSTIQVDNTAPDVKPDEFLASLDADSRAYLQLLVNGAGKGFEGRGDDFRAALSRLEPLNQDLERINGAVAERRDNLAHLIHNYGQLTTELGNRDQDLRTWVTQSNATLSAYAQNDRNLSQAITKLPPTLDDTQVALSKLNTLAQTMGPTFEALRPPFRKLDDANQQVIPFAKEGEPILRTQIRPFVQQARPYVSSLQPTATQLAAATPDLTQSFGELNRFFNLLSYNPGGKQPPSRANDQGYLFWLAWAAQDTTSVFSTSDHSGPFRRVVLAMDCTGVQDMAKQTPGADVASGLNTLLDRPGSPCPRNTH